MSIMKKIGAWFCAVMLLTGLIGGAWSFVGDKTVRDQQTVKSWLEDSGLYENIVESVLETAKSDAGLQVLGDVTANNPLVERAVQETFSPDFIKQNVEEVVDSTFVWLESDQAELDFTVDLTDAKKDFINTLGNLAAEKAESLPTCTSTSQVSDFEAINATCLPPSVTPEQVKAQVITELNSNQEFLEKTRFSSADIKVGENEQNFANSEEAASIKRAYRYSAYAFWTFVLIAIIGLVGLVFLSPRKLFGIRRAGGTFIVASVSLGVFWVFLKAGESITSKDITSPVDNQSGKDILTGLIREISTDIAGWLLWFVSIYILVGIALLVVAGITKRKQTKVESNSDQPSTPAEDKPTLKDRENSINNTNQPTKPSSRPPRKIQL